MKPILSFLLSTVVFATAFAQNETQFKKLLNQNGDTVILLGFVTKVNYSAGSKDSPTSMNFSGKDSTQSLTLFIPSMDRYKFKEAPETAFLNQYVQVKGRIKIYKGKPRITLHSEQQISTLRESFPSNKLGEPL